METGVEEGQQTLDLGLYRLCEAKFITPQLALSNARDVPALQQRLVQSGFWRAPV